MEVGITSRWVRSVLGSDTELAAIGLTVDGLTRNVTGIFETSIPGGADDYLNIVHEFFSIRGLSRARVNGPKRSSVTMLYSVAMIGRDVAASDLAQFVARFDELLDGKSGAVRGGRITHCQFWRAFTTAGYLGSIRYVKAGHIYTVRAERNSG